MIGYRLRRWRRKSGSESGQSLVELSLMIVVLMLLLAGLLDLGRMYFTYLALKNAAEEGAAFASIHPRWLTSSDAANPNNVTYRAKQESPSGLINWTSATVSVVQPPLIAESQPITVTVSFNYTLLTPFIGAIVRSQILPISATAVQQIQDIDN